MHDRQCKREMSTTHRQHAPPRLPVPSGMAAHHSSLRHILPQSEPRPDSSLMFPELHAPEYQLLSDPRAITLSRRTQRRTVASCSFPCSSAPIHGGFGSISSSPMIEYNAVVRCAIFSKRLYGRRPSDTVVGSYQHETSRLCGRHTEHGPIDLFGDPYPPLLGEEPLEDARLRVRVRE